MARYSLECVVLKSINYKDSDKIFTLYSRTKGKVSASAKGVRKISSRRAGSLDTLNHVLIGISESTNGYKTITEARALNSFKKLKKSLDKSAKGYYVSELVYRFVEEGHENRELFDLLISTLKKLDEDAANSQLILNSFEISLMKTLGYQLTLDRCVSCERKYPDDWKEVKFSYSLGGFVCDNCKGKGLIISKNTANLLHTLSLNKFTTSADGFLDVNNIVRPYIEDMLESRIKTTRIFKNV